MYEFGRRLFHSQSSRETRQLSGLAIKMKQPDFGLDFEERSELIRLWSIGRKIGNENIVGKITIFFNKRSEENGSGQNRFCMAYTTQSVA